jgi:hypothetical protein
VKAARDTLADALHRLPELARKVDQQPVSAVPAADRDRWHLALDEMAFGDFTAPPAGENVPPQGILGALGLQAVSLESLVSPVDLDPPTVADDSGFLDVLDQQMNLPDFLKNGIRNAYA